MSAEKRSGGPAELIPPRGRFFMGEREMTALPRYYCNLCQGQMSAVIDKQTKRARLDYGVALVEEFGDPPVFYCESDPLAGDPPGRIHLCKFCLVRLVNSTEAFREWLNARGSKIG